MGAAIKAREVLLFGLVFVLVAAGWQVAYGQEQLASEPAPQSAEQIQSLVAPIALYPDALVAQVLSAATFPDQVVLAENWQLENKGLTGQALATQVDQQPWDPSVKALTQFPSVLDNMAKNISWTSQLGEVYHYQPKDVMAAVQVLRAKAKAEGNLKSGSQMTVVQQAPDTIVIQPTNPQVVYVPQFNPTVVYGTTYVVPGYTVVSGYPAGGVAAASVLSFGAGIAVGALMAGGSSWGWSSWNVNWHGGYVGYGAHPYYGSTAWHGAYGGYGYHTSGPYGGATSYHGPYGSAATYHGYGPGGTYHTGGAYSNAYGAGTSHTGYGPGGSAHTGGSGYNASTGQSYHYGASSTAAGGTAYHGTTSTGQHYAGGTTASGQHYGGSTSNSWAHDNGWSTRASSDRGWGSMHASGYSGGGFKR
jgi:hypothetical protein